MKHMLYLVGLVVMAGLMAACAGDNSGSDDRSADDYAGFVAALEAAGASVEEGDAIEQSFFSVAGQVIQVNGEDVQVYEYDSAAAADADASLIGSDGASIGTSMVRWMAPPHFFGGDRIIAIYIGSDESVLAALESALGPQFAGQ